LSYQKCFQNQIWHGSGVCVGAGKCEKKEKKKRITTLGTSKARKSRQAKAKSEKKSKKRDHYHHVSTIMLIWWADLLDIHALSNNQASCI